MDTAADWLLSIGPKLDELRVYEAHVDAYDRHLEEIAMEEFRKSERAHAQLFDRLRIYGVVK